MSIRKMKLKDYGITPGRAAELKEMVKDNPMVEDDLFYSISKGVAFQVLARKGIDQNYKCHADVYGYKRKTLALFRSALQACGRYPF